MKIKKNLTWWQTIIFCLAFITIFFVVALLSDLVTEWIPNLSIRFIVSELILRLPLTLFFMHLFATKVIKLEQSAFYLGGFKKTLLKWLLIGFFISSLFLLLILVINPTEYLYKGDQLNSKWLIYYTVSTIIMAINGGFIEETLFRGYIMGLLKEKWNLKIAVLVPSALFGLIHLMMLETFQISDVILLFLGGSLVGVMFSLIVIKSGNVYAASIVHMVWNLFFAGQILKISNQPVEEIKSIFSIQLKTDHILLNGGGFGIEVSLIAIVLYTIVSIILLRKLKTH